MANVAIIDKVKSKVNYSKYFDFDFDEFHLCDKNVKRVLKKDVTLNTTDDTAEEFFDPSLYDYVILIGADACKKVGNISSVINYQGYLVNDKYIPLTNPSMLIFKPEGKNAFEKAVNDIHNYINGTTKKNDELNLILINEEDEAKNYLLELLNTEIYTIGLDTETSALYPRDGYVLGICIATSDIDGAYISTDIITEEIVEILQSIFNKVVCVFHNAKFDIKFLSYHFGFTFPKWEDTMLLHYCLNEQTGTHGLKQLAIKYTDLGDYDRDLEAFRTEYCRTNKIKFSDFSYDLIPFDILGKYGAIDPIATLILFNMFYDKVIASKKLNYVYHKLLKEGTELLIDIEENGVPFSIPRLIESQNKLEKLINEKEKKLYSYEEIVKYEANTKKIFNVNSPNMVRDLLFNILGLTGPGKLTSSGALSTDAEVLEYVSEQHPIAEIILQIKKAKKIKATYIDKVLISLDIDSRLRTGFNLTTTTSGRLSSSGKLNMQQLPRDDKTVKWCIKARDGYEIISQDLKTAEVYIVAALSGDKVLQQIFIEGGDYHSQMAKLKFDLPYTWQEIKEHHNDLRQAAKSVSFEILYKLNMREEILQRFPKLKRWLLDQKEYIEKHGYVYQFFGRKRRLPNVFSSNNEVKAHEVRSGVNALVQGPASDVNLLAAIKMNRYIKKHNMKTKIFGLVHDSVLAEVFIPEKEVYLRKLKEYTQEDRGVSIKNCPIGVDVEIGGDYSFKEDCNE